MCVYIYLCVLSTGSEKGLTKGAVQGTRKESGGKGVTAACRPLLPLPLPQRAIKHMLETVPLSYAPQTLIHPH